jgi:hypothetical protein
MNREEVLFNQNYQIIYFLAALIVLFLLLEQKFKNNSHKKLQNILLFVFSFAFILLFGSRGINVGIDTQNIVSYFTGDRIIFSFNELKDTGIYFISKITSYFTDNIYVFLTVLACLYIIPLYYVIRRFTSKNVFILFFLIISFFFFKSMGMNTMRQGIAASFFLLGLTYYLEKKYFKTAIFFFIAFLNHASILIVILITVFAKYFKRLTFPIAIYLIATLLSILNFDIYNILIKIPIVNVLVEDRLTGYVTDTNFINYRTGFRLDFFIFNTFFAIIGFFTYRNTKKFNLDKGNYLVIYTSYLLSSSVFFLMFSAAYSDRFGFLSWLFIPFLTLPYLQNTKQKGFLNIYSICFICFIIFIIFNYAL